VVKSLPVVRPRVWSSEGGVELDTYRFASARRCDAGGGAWRMVRGVSTRDYEAVIDTAAEGFESAA